MAILSDLHSTCKSRCKIMQQDSVPVPCRGLSLPILAYATNLDYTSLKYGRSLHKMLSDLQTTGSSHANISTPLKCTITVSHTDCALLHACIIHHIMHSLRLAPNNVSFIQLNVHVTLSHVPIKVNKLHVHVVYCQVS